MKSAWELALERSGGAVRQYTAEQKEQLAEVDRTFAARIAQARFDAQARKERAGQEPEIHRQIEADMINEISSLEERCERKKRELRQQFGQ